MGSGHMGIQHIKDALQVWSIFFKNRTNGHDFLYGDSRIQQQCWFTARAFLGFKSGVGQGAVLHARLVLPCLVASVGRHDAEDSCNSWCMQRDQAAIGQGSSAIFLPSLAVFITQNWTRRIHHSFTQPSIHSCIHSSIPFTHQTAVYVRGSSPSPTPGGLSIFSECTSACKWRVYITGLRPTAAGTIPLLSPVIWLSPALLATEGKGYYSFVASESSVLSELPSLSSSP